MASRTIKVDCLARVEGAGALKVVIRNGKVQSTELDIFEPPRFFEALLRGRAYTEAPDIVNSNRAISTISRATDRSSAIASANLFRPNQASPQESYLECGETFASRAQRLQTTLLFTCVPR